MRARDRAEAPGRPRDRRWWILAAAVTVVLLADQGTKYLAVRDLTFLFERADVVTLGDRVELFYREDRVGHLARAPVVIVDGLWRHRYSENRGASFNLLRKAPAGFRRVFFTLVTAMATAFVLLMTHRAPHRRPMAVLGLGALLGGALGNLVDRLSRGYVIDFIDWHVRAYPRLHWPTFNLADVGITVGAVVLLWQLAREALGHDA